MVTYKPKLGRNPEYNTCDKEIQIKINLENTGKVKPFTQSLK